jgi:DNA-binding NarL/FixJ family response regulator
VEQIELFRNQHPGGRIAIVADHYRPCELVSAFRAGANGYFVDVMACDVFIKSIELVMMGETIFPPGPGSRRKPAKLLTRLDAVRVPVGKPRHRC